ncbi:hypothetical protein OTL63_003207 [Salmonella enterica]|nr:hypothetical protein [Salmonella enterica]
MRKLQRLAVRSVHGTVKRIKFAAIHRPFVTGVHPAGAFVHDGMKMVVVIPPDLCLKTQITGVISDPFTFAVTDMWKSFTQNTDQRSQKGVHGFLQK